MRKLIVLILLIALNAGTSALAQISIEEQIRRGKELYEAGDYEEGILFLKKLSEKYPQYADIWYLLGKCYEGLGYFELAQECYKRTLSIDPTYGPLSEKLLKGEKELEKGPPELPPRLLREVRKIAILSFPKDESLKERGEPLAEAIAREIRSRLLRCQGIEVLANPLFENDINKLGNEVDLLIIISLTSSREKVGISESDFAVNVKVIDPLSRVIKWEQNIWIDDIVRESQDKFDSIAALTTLTKKIGNRIFRYWNLAPTIHPSRLDIERIEEEKRRLEWLKRSGIVAQIAWIDDKGKVVINVGAEKGVSKGDRFFVFRKGKPIIDPDRKEVIGYDEIIIGYIKIDMVRERISFGHVIEWIRKDIAVGDWVRKIVE